MKLKTMKTTNTSNRTITLNPTPKNRLYVCHI